MSITNLLLSDILPFLPESCCGTVCEIYIVWKIRHDCWRKRLVFDAVGDCIIPEAMGDCLIPETMGDCVISEAMGDCIIPEAFYFIICFKL